MAIISGALFSKGKGSLGNLTMTTQKGRVILKSKATVVSNPNTEAQQNQRKMISRAVIAWQMLGNVLKSGITTLVQYGSQYNTYVSKNAQFFADSTFTASTFKGLDVLNSWATIGQLPQVSYSTLTYTENDMTLEMSYNYLNKNAKVGDKLKVVTAGNLQSEFSYSEVDITSGMISAPTPTIVFENLNLDTSDDIVWAIWLESADGTKSSNSKFQTT